MTPSSPNYLVQSWNNLWPLPFFHSLYPMYQQISSSLLSEYNPNPAVSYWFPPFSSRPQTPVFCACLTEPLTSSLASRSVTVTTATVHSTAPGAPSTSASGWRCLWSTASQWPYLLSSSLLSMEQKFQISVKMYCCSPQNASGLPFTPIVKSAVL